MRGRGRAAVTDSRRVGNLSTRPCILFPGNISRFVEVDRHTEDVPSEPTPFPGPIPPQDELLAGIGPLLAGTHALWASPRERRRMRAFGFIPASEAGVLKRDWKGLKVRVSTDQLRVLRADVGELTHTVTDGVLVDGAPLEDRPQIIELTEGVIDIIRSYERWVEAREGREGRLSRGPWDTDRRPFNALAETRRLQRMLAARRR